MSSNTVALWPARVEHDRGLKAYKVRWYLRLISWSALDAFMMVWCFNYDCEGGKGLQSGCEVVRIA